MTNGSLLSESIVEKMKALNIIPSVSLDGPAEIHDENRVLANGNPSFEIVMKGINILRKFDFKIIINPAISWILAKKMDTFFKFIIEQKFDKIIFGRLVDTPTFYPNLSYEKYYEILEEIYKIAQDKKYSDIIIGNLEAFQKAINGEPDRVCTLIGNCCGAGTSNIIYLQKEVYPCGRMFNNGFWKLGDFNEDLEVFQDRMLNKLNYKNNNNNNNCIKCNLKHICIRDCILESISPHYNCKARKKFLNMMKQDNENLN